MLSLLLALALHAPGAVPTNVPSSNDVPAWTPIVAYDEVRIEADTARLSGAGPFMLWLRWSFLDRASSPGAWDAGARSSVDFVEVDCAKGAIRTFSSLAHRADGTPLPAASFDEPAAGWRVPRAETIGGQVTRQVCELARGRS